MQDPKVTIKDLLSGNWNPANTSGVTPQFSTGWYDNKANYPQVTITNEEEGVLNGGETGYSGIGSNGPTQMIDGTADVNCWSHREASSVNPKQLVFEFSEEIKRIIRANYDQAADLNFLAWLGRQERVETDKTPTVFRYLCQVRYGYGPE